jgi:heptosyltransferase I
MQMNKPQNNHKLNVLAVKLSSFGDLFHALPAVHNIKQELNARIDWVTQNEYAELVRCFKDVDRVIAFPRKHFFKNFRDFVRELRTDYYDIIIDFQGLLKSALPCLLAKGSRRIAPSFSRESSHILYREIAGKKNKNRHAIQENLDVVKYLNLKVLPITFPVSFPEYKISRVSPKIALIPFSRWQSKNWPIESFLDVGRKIAQNNNASVFLLADRQGRNQLQKIQLDFPCTDLSGKLSLVELASVLSQMDLVISNDSGPMHMAAAIGTPVLAVFGPTNPVRTGPYGNRHEVITQKLKCQPCYKRYCRFGNKSCLTGISSDTVVRKAIQMLESG